MQYEVDNQRSSLRGNLIHNYDDYSVKITSHYMYLKMPACYALPKHTRTHTQKKIADISQTIFSNGKFCIFIRISLKFVPKGPIDNK